MTDEHTVRTIPHHDWLRDPRCCAVSQPYFPSIKCDQPRGHIGWHEGYMPHYDMTPLRGAKQRRVTWYTGAPGEERTTPSP